jgi:hypothetical protein
MPQTPNKIIIVIPASDQATCNAYMKENWDSEGGDKTFTVGLSANGEEPFSHYWCNWRVDAATESAVTTHFAGVTGASVYNCGEYTNQQVLDALGLQPLKM